MLRWHDYSSGKNLQRQKKNKQEKAQRGKVKDTEW